MSINSEKLFKAASAAGFTTFEARFNTSSKTSISTFNGDVEGITVASDGSMRLRGVVNGKCGSFVSDRVDDEVVPSAIEAVKESAEYGQPIEPEFFIRGGEYEYAKLNTFSKKLDAVTADELVALAKKLSDAIKKADKRINNINVELDYNFSSQSLKNSNGLDIEENGNYLVVVASGDAKSGEEVVSGFDYEILTDIDKLDADAFVKRYVAYVVDQFGGESVKSGKYKVVYAPECVASLLSPLGAGFSAFNVEQHISLLEGKMGEKVFSELLTVEEKPLNDSPFGSTFDAEGIPCKNKTLIDKGVPTGYVYDLATAKRAGVKTTGNGRLEGGNVRPAVGYTEIAYGDKTREELFKLVGDGLFITEINGIGTGLNPQSGSYSLQAAGYVIENGKLARPVSLITVASNIMDDFKNILAVGNDARVVADGVKSVSIAVNEVAVSGK